MDDYRVNLSKRRGKQSRSDGQTVNLTQSLKYYSESSEQPVEYKSIRYDARPKPYENQSIESEQSTSFSYPCQSSKTGLASKAITQVPPVCYDSCASQSIVSGSNVSNASEMLYDDKACCATNTLTDPEQCLAKYSLKADSSLRCAPAYEHPNFIPTAFSGSDNEHVEDFVRDIEKAVEVNNWDRSKIPLFLNMYLYGDAQKFFYLLERRDKDLTWDKIKAHFCIEFFGPIEKLKLKAKLARFEMNDSDVNRYMYDVQILCHRIDPNMEEAAIVNNIMKGLRPDIKDVIDMSPNNNSLEELKDNLKRFQFAQYLVDHRL